MVRSRRRGAGRRRRAKSPLRHGRGAGRSMQVPPTSVPASRGRDGGAAAHGALGLDLGDIGGRRRTGSQRRGRGGRREGNGRFTARIGRGGGRGGIRIDRFAGQGLWAVRDVHVRTAIATRERREGKRLRAAMIDSRDSSARADRGMAGSRRCATRPDRSLQAQKSKVENGGGKKRVSINGWGCSPGREAGASSSFQT